ncbi:hypothetical protein BU15DRAFT_65215 [Melanogaster broomeanus]|nr:hypothetical protein BU15DRAFT_65215 [Melanogaster broomeanus]
MPQGCQTRPEIQWAIVRFSSFIDDERIAMCLNLSTRTVQRVLAHYRSYGTIPNSSRNVVEEDGTENGHLRDVDAEFLLGTIEKSPDLYLDELQEMLATSCGVYVSRATVWRTLRKAGFTMKKMSRVAVERSAQTRFSVLPALSLQDGFLHCSIVEGSFCTESFTTFISGLLDSMQPFPAPNSVIVMDNCRIHKHPDIQELIESRINMNFAVLCSLSPNTHLFNSMSQRRRKNNPTISIPTTEPSLAAPGLATNSKAKSGACSGCRTRKIACKFVPGETICIKCAENGRSEECVVQPSRTRSRGNSAPPPELPSEPTARKRRAPTPHLATTTSKGSLLPDGRQTPQSSDMAPHVKRQRSSSSHEPADVGALGLPAGGLNSIPELDEFNDLYGLEHSNDEAAELGDPVEFMSAITGGGPIDFDFKSEVDGDETRGHEYFDLEQRTTGSEDDNSNLGDSDTDDGLSALIEQRRPRLQPVAKHAHAKRLPPAKPASKGKALKEPSYDPARCVFKIRCAVPQSRGTKMSQIQFQISSNIALDELRTVVAEKLRRFPGLVKLQYRLDSKAKTAFTSIQSDDDLEMLIETVRLLIVPPPLANGKPSTRTMKPVIVYLDDAASEDESAGPAPTGNHNKAGARSSKQKPLSSSNPEMDGTEMQQEFIAALHERWKCDAHTKDSGNPVYCYNPPSTNVCYQLSHNSISYWAVQIGKGRATVDKKPPHVATQAARPRTRNVGSSLATDSDHQMAQNHMGPGPMSYP